MYIYIYNGHISIFLQDYPFIQAIKAGINACGHTQVLEWTSFISYVVPICLTAIRIQRTAWYITYPVFIVTLYAYMYSVGTHLFDHACLFLI
jgi:hypothetical protein